MTKNTCSCSVWTNGFEGSKCPDCGEVVQLTNIDKQVNLMDQFIADGEFDKAFQDVFGLPVEVVESLKEVC